MPPSLPLPPCPNSSVSISPHWRIHHASGSGTGGKLGIVNLFVRMPSSGSEVGELHVTRPLGGDDRARHVLPDLESLRHFSAILGGGEPVASRSEVLGDGTIRGEEPLRMTRRLEPLHVPLPLAGRLM
jgi:hypothetical protein